MDANHYSVLLEESVSGLKVKKDGIYVDGTLGLGGHSEAILKLLDTGHLYGFDQDENAIAYASKRLEPFGDRFTAIHDNFRNLKKDLEQFGTGAIDGMVMDLGVSSPMLDDPERGFTYRMEGPLDMRMDPEGALSAEDVVNSYSQKELVRILREYGEENFAPQIASAICRHRLKERIVTTTQLADIIKESLPARVLNKKGHPAKKSFQAIRIEVNDELGALEEALEQALEMLKPGGRLAVISFQSLEDRIVKTTFKKHSSVDEKWKKLPLKESEIPQPLFRLVTNSALTASEKELEENHRSHSAKLRIIERRTDL